ncbi:MAG: rhodanese-like domain-containing protein [Limisphaerales bacterium]
MIDYEVFCGVLPEPEPTANPDEVTVQDMKKALDNPSLGIKVVDVREPDEYEIAKVAGVPLLPLSELQNRFTELDPNTQYYLHCKAGVRSLKALGFLREQGFNTSRALKAASPRGRTKLTTTCRDIETGLIEFCKFHFANPVNPVKKLFTK